MAGARRAIPRLTGRSGAARNPIASSEPLPRRPVCSEYCLYRFMSVLYGISYFVSILLRRIAYTECIDAAYCYSCGLSVCLSV